MCCIIGSLCRVLHVAFVVHVVLVPDSSDVERLKAEVVSLKKQLTEAAAAQAAMQARAMRAESEVRP